MRITMNTCGGCVIHNYKLRIIPMNIYIPINNIIVHRNNMQPAQEASNNTLNVDDFLLVKSITTYICKLEC